MRPERHWKQVPLQGLRRGTCFFFCLAAAWGLFSFRLYSQQRIQVATDLEIFGTATIDYRQLATEFSDIEGTPYLEEAFSEGSVLIGSTLYKGVMLRYNAYRDRFEARLEDRTVEIDPVKTLFDTIYYRGGKYVLKTLSGRKAEGVSHVEVLAGPGDPGLYKQYRVTLDPATAPGAYSGAEPAQFRTARPEYFLEKDGAVLPFRGWKSLAGLFGRSSSEVKSYAREHGLDPDREEDLVALIRYFSENE